MNLFTDEMKEQVLDSFKQKNEEEFLNIVKIVGLEAIDNFENESQFNQQLLLFINKLPTTCAFAFIKYVMSFSNNRQGASETIGQSEKIFDWLRTRREEFNTNPEIINIRNNQYFHQK